MGIRDTDSNISFNLETCRDDLSLPYEHISNYGAIMIAYEHNDSNYEILGLPYKHLAIMKTEGGYKRFRFFFGTEEDHRFARICKCK